MGKTTTAVNLSASLAAAECRTLLVDCDPQGNTTGAIGFPKDPARRTLYNALILKEPLDRIIVKTQVEGLDLIPSDKNLAGAAVELISSENREFHLKTSSVEHSGTVSIRYDRLPACAGLAFAQRAGRERCGARSDSMRILGA